MALDVDRESLALLDVASFCCRMDHKWVLCTLGTGGLFTS